MFTAPQKYLILCFAIAATAAGAEPLEIQGFNAADMNPGVRDHGHADLVAARLGGADQDADGREDFADNCLTTANADQRDTDADGYGNACDADLDNNGVVNVLDLGLLSQAFFQPPGPLCGDAD